MDVWIVIKTLTQTAFLFVCGTSASPVADSGCSVSADPVAALPVAPKTREFRMLLATATEAIVRNNTFFIFYQLLR